MFKKIINRIKKIDFLVFLIALILLLIIVALILRSRNSLAEIDNSLIIEDGGQNLQNNQDVKPVDKPDFKSLLEKLPYISADFDVNNLPLELDVDPKLVVVLKGNNARTKFNTWIKQFDIQKNLSIEFVDNEPLD